MIITAQISLLHLVMDKPVTCCVNCGKLHIEKPLCCNNCELHVNLTLFHNVAVFTTQGLATNAAKAGPPVDYSGMGTMDLSYTRQKNFGHLRFHYRD